MIKTFQHNGLKLLFETGNKRGVTPKLSTRLIRKLDALDSAKLLNDLNLPGYRLHPLTGNRKETWSIWVNGNWRLTFTFKNGDAYDVDLEDYH